MKIEYHNWYTHFVLVTANRFPLIAEEHRPRIEKYITGIVDNNHSKIYAVYANPEHVHLLVSRSPRISEETLANIIGESTERFINNNKLSRKKFMWQPVAAAFSVSKGEIDKVCKYILNQPMHHNKVTFAEEYNAFLKFYQKTLVVE